MATLVRSCRAEIESFKSTSDDFFPELDDEHRLHIANNATTGYLDRVLSIIRDFDMFMTSHKTAHYHGLLRSLSNAPLYITDTDKADSNVLARLGGTTPSGAYRLVQASNGKAVKLPHTAFIDVTAESVGPALRVGLPIPIINGAIIGVWNCRKDGQQTIDTLTLEDVKDALGLLDGKPTTPDEIVVFENESAKYTPISLSDHERARDIFEIRLESGSCCAYSVAPVLDTAIGQVAVLGLLDKYAGLCAISKVETNGRVADHLQPAPRTEPQPEKPVDIPEADSTAPTEQTPLLSRSRAGATDQRTGLRTRLWTLLLFWRRDLQALRTSLLRDFLGSPVSTLVRELRAVFGGPLTVTVLAEAAAKTPSIRSAESSLPPPEIENAEIDSQPAILIDIIVAGRLGLVVSGAQPSGYTFKLGSRIVDATAIEWHGDLAVIDTEKALKAEKYSDAAADTFRIAVSRK